MRIGIFLSLLLVASVCRGQLPSDSEAKSLMENGDFVGAIERYQKLVLAFPSKAEYWTNLGWSKLNASGFSVGKEELEKALELDKTCDKCMIGLAIFYLQAGDGPKAMRNANSAVEQNDTASFNYYVRAQIYEAAGMGNEAGRDYDQSIALNRYFPDYYYSRGNYHFRAGRLALAIKDFTSAIEINPGDAAFYYQRGYGHYMLGSLTEALEDVMRAIERDSLNADYWLGRGAIEDAGGLINEALASYNYVLSIEPEHAMALFNRANVFYSLNRIEESCRDFARSLQLIKAGKPSRPDMDVEIAGMLSNHCDTGMASFFYQRGLAALESGLKPEALQIFDEGLKRFPYHPILHAMKGTTLLMQQRYAQAISAFNTAMSASDSIPYDIRYSYILTIKEMDPASYMRGIYASAYEGRARAHLALGNAVLAMQDVDKAIYLGSKVEGHPVENYQVLRANILSVLGKHQEALTIMDGILRAYPDLALGYVLRARINMALELERNKKKVKFELEKNSGMLYLVVPKKWQRIKWDEFLVKAIKEDIATALAKQNDIAEAYFLLAQLDYFRGEKEYCVNLIKAMQNGLSEAPSLLGVVCE